jgi:CRISPR-associated endonuclease/helicase Cas3
MWNTFTEFFRAATNGRDPYPYQERFAESSPLPHLLRAPTGAGKTATAVLGWLWQREKRPKATPRRLVYCLPMRVLVEQSHREAAQWLDSLGMRETVSLPRPLMGGSDAEDWHLHPETPAILIGTQDMLLSRALNRGYAAGRFHWPIDFGLLNSDCLWVFDEPQIMAGGVSTSAQLAGLRKSLGVFGECASVWMSATLEPGWLDTIDFRAGRFDTPTVELAKADDDDPRLKKRMTAAKTLGGLGATSSKDMKDVAAAVLAAHKESEETQTLVVLNTVDRAKATYDALRALRKRAELPRLLLVHSRFRPHERQRLNDQLQDKGDAAKDRIIVATQVVEAGVDISSRTLVTELAPWASVVQRIGRCNRTGDDGPGRVFWIDLPDEKQAPPYEWSDLDFARTHLTALDGKAVSPKALDDYKKTNKIVLPFSHKHVVRRRDVLDLFDTSPDLSGNDIDVSRFVRSDDPDTDVQVFWRAIGPNEPDEDEPDARRAELCNVPVGRFREFASDLAARKLSAFVWDHIEREWVKLDPRQVRPGLTVLLPASAGGYSLDLGWTGDAKDAVEPLPPAPGKQPEATATDANSETPNPRTVAEHTNGVCKAVDAILGELAGLLTGDWANHLRKAARWHDAGKAHPAFQAAMRKANDKLAPDQHWAKSGGNGRLIYGDGRRHFRHELASALAVLKAVPFGAAYLIACHHGKVRLSIRAVPGEKPPDSPETLFALGVRDGDELPPVDLGDGERCKGAKLDLSPMRLGGESWTGRALELLAELGPFRLAYLEALLRAADQRVSNAERKGESP